MTTKSTSATAEESDELILAEMDNCLFEIARIRREMKKTDVEIKRLEASTRRKLVEIRANFNVKKAA